MVCINRQYQKQLIIQSIKQIIKQRQSMENKTQAKRKRFEDIRKVFDKIGYDPIKSIGKGAFGEVILAKNKSTGIDFAVKVLGKSKIKKKPYLQKYINQQVEIMKRLSHPNIVKLVQFIECKYLVIAATDFYFIIMEYCEQGNLLSYQANLPGRVFELNHAIQVLVEIMKGLKWIHQSTYVHRDIKSENVLLKKQYTSNGYAIRCKIADFGLARPIGKENDAKTYCGTQKYMAPEIMNNSYYGISIDLWSLAVLFYFMLFAQYPFKGKDIKSDIYRKCTPFFDLNSVLSKKQKLRDMPSQVYDFFKQIFILDFGKRITFSKIIKHPLFAKHFHQFHQSEIFYKNYEKNEPLRKEECIVKSSSQEDLYNQMEPEDQSRIYIERKHKLPHNVKHIQKFLQEINFEIQKIQYLSQCALQLFINYSSILTYGERLITKFYLLRAYLFFSESLIRSLQAKKIPQSMRQLGISPSIWDQCTQTEQYRKILKKFQQQQLRNQFLYEDMHCLVLSNIKLIPIEGIGSQIKLQITEKDFNEFKKSYRVVTSYIFKLFTNKTGINSLLLKKIQLRIFCCHLINRIFSRKDWKKNFPYFCKWLQNNNIQYSHTFDLSFFKQWVMNQDQKKLGDNIKLIYKMYF